MELKRSLKKATELGLGLVAIATLTLAGCGGGGLSNSTTTDPYKGSAGVTVSTPAITYPTVPANNMSVTPQGLTTSDGITFYATANNAILQIAMASGVASAVAGTLNVTGAVDGIGAAARFNNATAIATDGASLYVADQSGTVLRKVDIATSTVTTLAGSAGLAGAVDGQGAAARFGLIAHIVVVGGNLYVTDNAGNTIRKIDALGNVTTFVGTAGLCSTTSIAQMNATQTSSLCTQDGVGTAARLIAPNGLASDGTNLYAPDYFSNIRKINIATGAVTTINCVCDAVISGILGWQGTRGVATDGTKLYTANPNTSARIIGEMTLATNAFSILAGWSGIQGRTDGAGNVALFTMPTEIISFGNTRYVVDNGAIRKIQ